MLIGFSTSHIFERASKEGPIGPGRARRGCICTLPVAKNTQLDIFFASSPKTLTSDTITARGWQADRIVPEEGSDEEELHLS